MDAKLAAEVEAAMGDMSVEDMMDFGSAPPPQRGGRGGPAAGRSGGGSRTSGGGAAGTRGTERQRKTGTIMSIHGDDVFVEFGPKSQGVCKLTLFEEAPALGSQMEFIVERYDKEDGLLILTRQGQVQKAEWESLEVGQVIEARCVGVNKGGLEMEVANHRAFMPAGQVDLRHIAELSVFVGEKMPCEVTEVDRQRGRIILSRRKVQEVDRKHARDNLLMTLEVGQTMPAVITSIQAYGAFADIGGLDGLIHISDIAYERLKHPSEVLKEGQQVTVKVLKIETKDGQQKIGLGLKQTQADPAMAVREQIKPGESLSGRVTRIMPFGAFVELAPGLEGLIHISELSHDRVHDVRKVVKPDEIITVKILSVDSGGKKISLSLKAMKDRQEYDAEHAERKADANMRKAMATLSKKFGAIPLKGGIG